jgi:lipopolysaccharide/colanic/teichoic acid biosynthesis glycosyltransferase
VTLKTDIKSNDFEFQSPNCGLTERSRSDQEVGQYPVLSFSSAWGSHVNVAFKELIDIVVSVTALILLSPLFLVLAIAVKLSSPGPVFYRWRVIGKKGAPFLGYKFRSMVADADQLKSGLEPLNEMDGPVFKLSHDPRVTPLGVWMRRYSLDELPQLFSVLKGDMSLVGPRPPLATEYSCFSDFQKQKLAVKPGITCLWQINGRNEVKDFDDWVRLDLEYIRRWSPKLDLWILFKTIGEVFAGSGK